MHRDISSVLNEQDKYIADFVTFWKTIQSRFLSTYDDYKTLKNS